MASERRQSSSIEEGWQEVDDNHSVRSLSADDEESEDDLVDLSKLTLSPPRSTSRTNPATEQASSDANSNANNACPSGIPSYSSSSNALTTQPSSESLHRNEHAGSFAVAVSDSPILKQPATFCNEPQVKPFKAAPSPPSPPEFTLDQLDHIAQLAPVQQTPENHPHVDPSAPFPPFRGYATHGLDDPSIYIGALRYMTKMLLEIGDETRYRVDNHASFRVPVVYKIQDTMGRMLQHLQDLDPILEAYAAYWAGRHDREGATVTKAADIPINGSMLEWIDALHERLMLFQVRMEEQVRSSPGSCGPGQSVPTPASVGAALETTAVELERQQLSMADFLPLFQHDYSEFQTKQTNMPLAEVDGSDDNDNDNDDSDKLPARRYHADHVRENLTSLKNQMLELLVLLCELGDPEQRTRVPEPVAQANLALTNLVSAANIILGPGHRDGRSDWVDSGPGRRRRRVLPEKAFATLSPDILDDVTRHMHQIYMQLDVSDPAIKSQSTPYLIRAHQMTMLIEGGQLQELLSTTSFLEYLLMPET
jgi:hypothetical protein